MQKAPEAKEWNEQQEKLLTSTRKAGGMGSVGGAHFKTLWSDISRIGQMQ